MEILGEGTAEFFPEFSKFDRGGGWCCLDWAGQMPQRETRLFFRSAAPPEPEQPAPEPPKKQGWAALTLRERIACLRLLHGDRPHL